MIIIIRKTIIHITPIIEFKKRTIERYNETAPNTIGFLLYLYGPVVTSFLVCGLIDTPNASTGPPLPTVNKKIFDHTAKIAPTKKINAEMMYRNISELKITLPENK